MQVRLDEDLTRETVGPLFRDLVARMRRSGEAEVRLHLGPGVQLDSAGVGFLSQLAREAAAQGKSLLVESLGDDARRKLAMYAASPPPAGAREAPPGYLERIGGEVAAAGRQVFDFFVLLSDTTAFSLRGLVKRTVPWRTFVEQCILLGYQSLPVIALISFLVGLTTALQAAYQLRQFGANIYIANLVGVAMVAEMGPLMTAILMAGRSGSAIAAEISTMVIGEEIDALKTMGINPLRYVLVPKMYALALMQPLLSVMATVVGILGGLLVAVTYLDLSVVSFWNQLVGAVETRDLLVALLKSFTFAGLIGLVAGHVGFRASGGAAGVGRSTTASVVASILLVIAADAIYSLIFYFGD